MNDNSINFVKAKHGKFLHYNFEEFVGLSIREYGEWSEFLLKKGFIDHIVSRNEMKETISSLIEFLIEKWDHFGA